MNDLDQVLPHQGLAAIRFGCTQEHVRKLLGCPDATDSDEDGDIELEYLSLGLRFSFWKSHELRLGYISSQRAGIHLQGVSLLNKDESFIWAFVQEKLKEQVSESDGCVHEDGRVQTWMDVNALDLTFWFLNGSLYMVDWGAAWIDGETPNWDIPAKA